MTAHRFDPSYAQPAEAARCIICAGERDDEQHDLSVDAQRRRAIAIANANRRNAAQVKREVRAGKLAFAVAVYDERAGSAFALDLVAACPGWGRVRAFDLFNQVNIWEQKRVRDLTQRQRAVLADRVQPQSRQRRAA